MKNIELATPPDAKEGKSRSDLRLIFGDNLDDHVGVMIASIILLMPKEEKDKLPNWLTVMSGHLVFFQEMRVVSVVGGRKIAKDYTMKIGSHPWLSLYKEV